jgi:hypothetical protein
MGHRRHTSNALSVTALLASLLAAGLLTGCGSDTATPAAKGAAGQSSLSDQPPSASPSAPVGGEGGGSGKGLKGLPGKLLPGDKGRPAGKSPSAPAGEMVLVGQVDAGVEGNCLVMQSGGQLYLLVGGDQNVVKPGNKIVARGRVAKGMMSTCMQGQPFQVTEAHLGVSTTRS